MDDTHQDNNLTLRSARRARLEGWAAVLVLPILRDGAARLLRMRS
jgi:hypothetical protein